MSIRILVLCAVTFVGCKKNEEAKPVVASGSGRVAVGSATGSGSASGSATSAGSGADPWAAKPHAAEPIGAHIMDEETIGGLKIGSPADDVVKALGEPNQKTKAEESPATGDVTSTWSWPGVEIAMAKKADAFAVLSFEIKAPSKLATSRRITVGSASADVKTNYVQSTDAPNADPNAYLVGSPYGGELFTFKDGKVAEMFLGAMAE